MSLLVSALALATAAPQCPPLPLAPRLHVLRLDSDPLPDIAAAFRRSRPTVVFVARGTDHLSSAFVRHLAREWRVPIRPLASADPLEAIDRALSDGGRPLALIAGDAACATAA